MPRRTRVVVVGGGIAGLTVAERLGALVDPDAVAIEVREATGRLGGKLKTSPFAGSTAIDEGADAFLARVPAALGLARRVGLGDALTSPTDATASVWHGRLYAIPDGLLLGVPGTIAGLAASRLLSVRGKLRAAIEPLLPRTTDHQDSIGRLVRRRFGDEVHERLVDALIGSIYAADTDRFSLAMVPQLADLAETHRSLLLGARRARRSQTPAAGVLFAAPLAGMETMATATAAAAAAAGVTVHRDTSVAAVSADGARWRVDDDPADVVVLATPAAPTAALFGRTRLGQALAAMEHAGVVIITMAVDAWPGRLAGRSGYLVPKPVQGLVTAASFGSQKWAHWQGDDEIIRVSLGRDGLDVAEHDDEVLVDAAVSEVSRHLTLDLQPLAVRISRWPQAFPQYRPGHRRWLDEVAAATPSGLFLTGASYRGIGVPACIADAERTAAEVVRYLDARRNGRSRRHDAGTL